MRITELVNLQTARNQQLPPLYLDIDGVQDDSLNETTSAGCIATVAQPLGELQQRLPRREKGKYKNSAPVVR